MVMKPTIVAMGGAALRGAALARYIVELTGKPRPRIAFLPTATGDADSTIVAFYAAYMPFAPEITLVRFFQRTPRDLRRLALEQDVIHVGGGNTKSMLAVWREYGFDKVLAEAYEKRVVLCGASAGSICWFEEGVTDSFEESLSPLACLGILKGSNCPHYDSEPERRPSYHHLVREKLIRPGIAADDGVALHFVDGELERVVSASPTGKAYRLELAGSDVKETVLPCVQL
jgi:dipeptidase E